jgi:hypothetical protein
VLLLVGSASATFSKAAPLNVLVTGGGSVRVGYSTPHRCNSFIFCRWQFQREPHLRLQAIPNWGAEFISWTGCVPTNSRVCHLRQGSRSVHVRFSWPGGQFDPVPFGQDSNVVGGRWNMTVLSARKEGSDLIVRIEAKNWFLTNWTFGLADWIFLREGKSAELASDQCIPPAPNFLTDVGVSQAPYGPGAVAPNETVTGNLCFPLRGTPKKLFVEPASEFPPPAFRSGTPIKPPHPPFIWSIWFALH